MSMDAVLEQVVLWLATVTEAISTAIIGLGVAHAAGLTVWILVRGAVQKRPSVDLTETVRLRLGRWLALALEFQLAADIAKTAVAPTWDDIGKVAAIIVLRTVLNFFLEREIEKAERRLAPAAADAVAG